MIKLAFLLLLNTGVIIPTEDMDGRQMYELYDQDCKLVADFAYKGEIMLYLETGVFKYNEDLPDNY